MTRISISSLTPGIARASASGTADEIKASLGGMIKNIEDFKAATDKSIDVLSREIRDIKIGHAMTDVGYGDFSNADLRHDRESFANFGRGIRAAMTSDSNPDGGYLIPRTIEVQIARIARDATPMRSLARVVTTESNSYVKTVSLNGPTATWVGEKETRNQTPGMKLSELEFVVDELQAMPAVTQRLLDDARVDVAGELSLEIATAFSEMEDTSFVNGDGVRKPRGFMTATKVANASWAWGKLGFTTTGVANNIFDNTHNGVDALHDIYYSLKAPYRANATWLMNSNTANVLSKLKDGEENYLWQPSMQVGMPASLLGRPVVIDENMPGIEADTFPVAFGDFERGYLIVDRTGIRVLRDPYSSKPYVLFYTTKRVGGGVQDYAAIKLLKIAV